MTVRSFDQRLSQIGWQPTTVPSQVIIDDILGRPQLEPMQVKWMVFGALMGIVIGFGIKGTIVPGAPFGAHADTLGFVVGALALLAGLVSAGGAVVSIAMHRRWPQLMRFSMFNMLMILVLMIS